MEVLIDAVIGQPEYVRFIRGLLQDNARIFRRAGGEKICPVVEGPHDRKLQPRPVARLKKSILELFLKKLGAVEPIPVDHPDVNPKIGCRLDLALGPLWIGFIEPTPYRIFREEMAWVKGLRISQYLKFCPAFAKSLLHEGAWVPGGIVVGDDLKPFVIEPDAGVNGALKPLFSEISFAVPGPSCGNIPIIFGWRRILRLGRWQNLPSVAGRCFQRGNRASYGTDELTPSHIGLLSGEAGGL